MSRLLPILALAFICVGLEFPLLADVLAIKLSGEHSEPEFVCLVTRTAKEPPKHSNLVQWRPPIVRPANRSNCERSLLGCDVLPKNTAATEQLEMALGPGHIPKEMPPWIEKQEQAAPFKAVQEALREMWSPRAPQFCAPSVQLPSIVEGFGQAVTCRRNSKQSPTGVGKTLILHVEPTMGELGLESMSVSDDTVRLQHFTARPVVDSLMLKVIGGDYSGGTALFVGDVATIGISPLCVSRTIAVPTAANAENVAIITIDKESVEVAKGGTDLTLVLPQKNLRANKIEIVQSLKPESSTAAKIEVASFKLSWSGTSNEEPLTLAATSTTFDWDGGCLHTPKSDEDCPSAFLADSGVGCKATRLGGARCHYNCKIQSTLSRRRTWCGETSAARTPIGDFQLPTKVVFQLGTQEDRWEDRLLQPGATLSGFADRADRQFTVTPDVYAELVAPMLPKPKLPKDEQPGTKSSAGEPPVEDILPSQEGSTQQQVDQRQKTFEKAKATCLEKQRSNEGSGLDDANKVLLVQCIIKLVAKVEVLDIPAANEGTVDCGCSQQCNEHSIAQWRAQCVLGLVEGRAVDGCTYGWVDTKGQRTTHVELFSSEGRSFRMNSPSPARLSVSGLSCGDSLSYRHWGRHQNYEMRQTQFVGGRFVVSRDEVFQSVWLSLMAAGGVVSPIREGRETEGGSADPASLLSLPAADVEGTVQVRWRGVVPVLEVPLVYQLGAKVYHPLGVPDRADDARTELYNRVFSPVRLMLPWDEQVYVGFGMGPGLGWRASDVVVDVDPFWVFEPLVLRFWPVRAFSLDVGSRVVFPERVTTFRAAFNESVVRDVNVETRVGLFLGVRFWAAP